MLLQSIVMGVFGEVQRVAGSSDERGPVAEEWILGSLRRILKKGFGTDRRGMDD